MGQCSEGRCGAWKGMPVVEFNQARAGTINVLKTCTTDMRWFFLGPSFLVAITTLTHFTNGYKTTAFGISYADVICSTSIAVALCVLAALHRNALFGFRRTAIVTVTALAACGFLVMKATATFAPDLHGFALILSAISMGLFLGVAAPCWFDFFVGQTIETVAFSLFASIIGGCAISWFLLGMTQDRLIAGYCTVVVLAGFSLAYAREKQPMRPNRLDRGERPSFLFLAGPLLTAFLFSFAFMLSVSLVGLESWHTDAGWSMLWPAALVLCAVALFSKRFNIASLLYLALTLIVAGMLFASFLHVDRSFIFSLATMGCAVNVSYLVILFCNIGGRFAFSSYKLATLLLLSVFGGCLLGRPAAFVMSSIDRSGALTTLLSICLIIGIIACTLVNLNNRTIQLYSKYRFKDRGGAQSPAVSSLVASYAIGRGLGAREQEALSLLLAGKTASEVADEMFIAHGTAKAHIRHIYQKLDVHDRVELFDLMRDVDPHFKAPNKV